MTMRSRRIVGHTSACLLLVLAMASSSEAQSASPSSVPGPSNPRIFVSAGGGMQSQTPAFAGQRRLSLHAEEAVYDTRYGGAGGTAMDVGGGVRVWRSLWLGGAFTRTNHRHGADVSASLPHPFRFNDPRTISGRRDGLERTESALHLHAMFRFRLAPRVGLAVFAGPARIDAEQEIVNQIGYDETYPYDTATLTGATTSTVSSTATTVGMGASVNVAAYRGVSLDVGIRHASSEVSFESVAGSSVRAKVGGTQFRLGAAFEF